jgi:hypothetical protein
VLYIGFGLFFLVAILCIVAFLGARKQRRHYEETGSLEG